MRRDREILTTVHHAPRRERDGSFAIHRIERAFNGYGELLRLSEAIIAHGLPSRRSARAQARAQHRMQEAASP